jgi:hypothetical protein
MAFLSEAPQANPGSPGAPPGDSVRRPSALAGRQLGHLLKHRVKQTKAADRNDSHETFHRIIP